MEPPFEVALRVAAEVATNIRRHPRLLKPFVRSWLRYPVTYLAAQQVAATPGITVADLFPDGLDDPPTVEPLDRLEYNVRLDEQFYLGCIARGIGAKRIFEIGTFDGRTTRYLARVAGHGAHVWTIDLPDQAFPPGGFDGWFI